MDSIGSRIKWIREQMKDEKGKKWTQERFAQELNIKRNTIATYEVGKSLPSDSAVSLICRTFDVDENWLRTGEGEPFTPEAKKRRLTDFFKDSDLGTDEFKTAFISGLAKLSPDEWAVLAKLCKRLVSENEQAAQDFVYKVDTPEGEKEFLVERTPLPEKKPNDKKTDS